MLKHRNSLQKSLCPVVVCPYLCSLCSSDNACELSSPATHNTQRTTHDAQRTTHNVAFRAQVHNAGSQRIGASLCNCIWQRRAATPRRQRGVATTRVASMLRKKRVATTRDVGCENAVAKPLSLRRLALRSGRNKKPNRTDRTEPKRVILEPAGTGRGNKPNRSGPSHDAPEKRRPNRVEPGKLIVRTEPNR